MQLQLIASAMSAAGAVDKISTTFGMAGGSIGRDINCQMVLPDPHRRISRIQAQVFFEDSHFFLNNASSSNPIYVNGIELKPGENSPIRHGDEWRAGNYIITVLQSSTLAKVATDDPRQNTQTAETAPAPSASSSPALPALLPAAQDRVCLQPEATPAAGPFDDLLSASVEIPQAFAGEPSRQCPPEPSPHLADPFANPAIPLSTQPHAAVHPALAGDPFADLLSTPITQQIAQAPGHEQRWQSHAAIPDDFDPMALASLSSRNAADPLHGLSGTGSVGEMFPQGSVDSIFSPSGTSIEPMTRNPLDASAHDSVLKINRGLDPLVMFSSMDSAPPSLLDGDTTEGSDTAGAPAVSNHTSELAAFFRPPTPARQSPAADPPSLAGAPSMPAQLAQGPDEEPPQAPSTAPPPHEAVPPAQAAGHETFTSLESLFDLDPGPPADAATAPILADLLSPLHTPHAPPQEDTRPLPEHGRADDADPALDERAIQAGHSESLGGRTQAQDCAKQPQPHDQPAETSPDARQLLQAFKAGAGLSDCRYPETLTPELMHMVGRMMASSLQGCMDLLGSRASTKQEVRMAVTLINAEANNPLKFLPAAPSAMAQIFGPKMPGFMAGPTAVEDAYLDLRLHQAGMAAGTQAALQGLFERFDPKALEEQLDSQGRQRTLFASQRNARLWELYRARYEWLKEEVKSQSPASWGDEFYSAYAAEAHKDDKEGNTK